MKLFDEMSNETWYHLGHQFMVNILQNIGAAISVRLFERVFNEIVCECSSFIFTKIFFQVIRYVFYYQAALVLWTYKKIKYSRIKNNEFTEFIAVTPAQIR